MLNFTMVSQADDEKIRQKLIHCSDDRRLPEASLLNRRKSFGSIGSDLFHPEDEVKSNSDMYTRATSDLQTLNDMFAKFRPVAKKKHNQDHHDDAALFAYMERRSSSSVSVGKIDRRDSKASTSTVLTSSSDGFGDEKSNCGSLSSLFGRSFGLNRSQHSVEEPPFQVAVRKCPSKRGNAVYRRGKLAAENKEWEKAVHYYHIALVKQRSYYGEDHLNTAETLSCLGLALMELGEQFAAITALEECLHIRQNLLGPGAEECAVTTNDISRVLNSYKQQNSVSC